MKYSITAILALTVIVSGCATFTQNDSSEPDDIDDMVPNSTNATVVEYSSSGFQPSTVTVEQGETVMWASTGPSMWIGSDQHPSHTEYSGTSLDEHCQNGESDTFDQCETSQTYSFTFNQTGEWSYHNHVRPGDTGTVIVE
ncbi:cupredoxin domain-containing protein [Candidatus Nanohalovita haloferacivicina]|uniref:cupredoxin domain-containing protein n=1 Tax=Candidatus Nanohalovita haloferacivicina TaxID=2978046 RepID=UPI00325FB368